MPKKELEQETFLNRGENHVWDHFHWQKGLLHLGTVQHGNAKLTKLMKQKLF